MKTYAGAIQTEERKTSYIVGDKHLNRGCKDKFSKSLTNRCVYVESFSGTKPNQLDYYIVPMLAGK